MRNLTIKRRKSFASCLAKTEIYIEDPMFHDFVVNDTPCRKIGELKNAEEKTFQITEEAAKIFIIADKSNKNYCKTYYQLTSGNDDIFLSGKCVFAIANAFRLDQPDTGHMTICKNVSKKRPANLTIGIIAVASPLPMLLFTSFWSVIFGIGFGISVLGYSTIPDWMEYLCLLPLSFSPVFDVFGIIFGALRYKKRYSLLCIILSALGLLINFALIFGIAYIGSRY